MTLTPQQRETLAWLRTIGHATPSALERHGRKDFILEALVEKGLAERVTMSHGATHAPTVSYRPT